MPGIAKSKIWTVMWLSHEGYNVLTKKKTLHKNVTVMHYTTSLSDVSLLIEQPQRKVCSLM